MGVPIEEDEKLGMQYGLEVHVKPNLGPEICQRRS